MEQKKLAFIQENAPCYLYDSRQITDRCRMLKAAMPDETFLYSVKTNPFEPVVSLIAGQGMGADAASANEVLLAARAGISSSKIYYSAPGKTLRDLEKAWGRCIIIADSLSELNMLEKYAAEKNECASVGIRINPDFSMSGAAAAPSKFGIDEDKITPAALSLPHLKITGIHVHLRSQVLDTDMLCAYYRNCYELAERINKIEGAEISFINFGSGIGTVYDELEDRPVLLEKISEIMKELQQKNSRSLRAEFIVETGRFLVCNAGKYYTRVADRKESCGKTYIIVQNAMNGFLRPAIAELLKQCLGKYPAGGMEPLYTSAAQCSYRIIGREADPEKVDIAGNLCTALDVMAKDIILPRAEIGDILEVTNAGSYACTLSPQLFSSHEPPKEFLWEDES